MKRIENGDDIGILLGFYSNWNYYFWYFMHMMQKWKMIQNKLNILINSSIMFVLTFDLLFNDAKMYMMNGMNWF